ncbi:hypothetical protein QTP70_001038 [Hemibagrus guttatus]|uniref:Protein kinase domain-containing protein n=1 Tax=Hemibagrus guttatus TaxID=175788 RepID=A0AAE0QI30_9TELE|nr:hypothetical protein QTP70_001038 [Hemibagrus guttatus]
MRGSGPWKGPVSRKASQTSVYLQEWDIPFEQLDLGELIGKGRWGRVHRGRWHGEVAIRLLEIDGNNQDHLKLFKKEVMNYRQTRHENVVLFMGACMAPPHLAIITSFCKGRTLYSVVRDTKNTLDINKTRQIAQEIVKGMGYLHAKGIVHKDLKSKNVFHDTNKVVIADFGLFGISGVVQEGRRENELKLPHGWICYLAPEIVRKMSPGNNEDRLPFSNAADVYAFGTIWYELQARDWPITNQPAEATIWQVGSGEGIKKVLAEISLGKEVTEILSACWAYDLRERPTFTQLADMLEKLPKLNRRLSHPGHFWKPCRGAGGNWATVGGRSRGGRRVRRQREKRKGKSVGLRIGTLNVGTTTGKGRELADMMERRKVDILCVQETRWKGSKARSIGAGFKLFYYGVDSKRNGVGVVLKEEFVRNVLEVKRVSDRVMSLKLEIEGVMLNVVSGYAPQVGCELEEKERFWSELDEVMESIPTGERVVIGADFNGHVGEGNGGDEEVMGKFGVKERSFEGQVVVDFAKRMGMAVLIFRKGRSLE